MNEKKSLVQFQKMELAGIERRYKTYCTEPKDLVGQIVTTLVAIGGNAGLMFHIDRVSWEGIHLKNGSNEQVISRDFYWRSILLFD